MKKVISVYLVKAVGAFLSLAAVLLALNQLHAEDRIFYFRWLGISTLILIAGRSSVDFILVYFASIANSKDGRYYVAPRVVTTCFRGLVLCCVASTVAFAGFSIDDRQKLALLMTFSAPMHYVGAVASELSKGFNKPVAAAVFGDLLPSLPWAVLIFLVIIHNELSLEQFVVTYFLGAVLSVVCAIFFSALAVGIESNGATQSAPKLTLNQTTLLLTNLLSGPGIKHGLLVAFTFFDSASSLGLYVLLQRLLTLYRMAFQAAESFWVRDLIRELRFGRRFWTVSAYKKLLGTTFGSALLIFLPCVLMGDLILSVAKIMDLNGWALFFASNIAFLLCALMPSARKIASYQIRNVAYLWLALGNFMLFMTAVIWGASSGGGSYLVLLLPLFILWQSFVYTGAAYYVSKPK